MIALATQKIQALPQAAATVAGWRLLGDGLVFTNGCFDLMHPGHLTYLAAARALGRRLIVGLNSDASVTRLKGPTRPIMDEHARALLLASLLFVDLVVVFDEDTPLTLITTLQPDTLVKGGDYDVANIVGAPEVQQRGGQVVVLPFVEGYSTSSIEGRIRRG